MKKLSIIPRKDSNSFRVYFYEGGIRKNRSFTDKNDAIAFAQAKHQEMVLPDFVQVTDEDRIFIARIKTYGNTNEILKFLESNYRRSNINITLKQALDEFIELKEITRRRQRTLIDYKLTSKKLEEFYNMQLKDFSIGLAENFMKTSKSHSNRPKTAVCMSAFFNWCVEKKYATHNPFKQFTKSDTIKDKEQIKTLSPIQAESFMHALPDKLKAGFAVMMFAGVRPSEMFNDVNKPVLHWQNIDFKNKKILIKAESSKTRNARILQNLPANLWAWLNTYKKTSGKVIDLSEGRVAKNRRIACKTANIEYSQDILRHSFASYGYHTLGAERSVEIMGHIGGFAVFAKHYKGIASKAEATQFFKIMP